MRIDEILPILLDALERLVAILRLDPKCQWTAKFSSDIDLCLTLIREGYSKSDLAKLSSSITYVFQGMGSFSDYFPSSYDPISRRYAPIAGSEDFESLRKEVFDLAISLRADA